MIRGSKGSVLLMPVLGVIFLVIGLCNMKDYRDLKSRCTETTTATIFYNESKYSSKNRKYSAHASFKIGEDEYYVKTGDRKRKYKEGQVISVRYDASDPNVNYSPTYPPDKGIVMSLFGAGNLALFAVCLFHKEKRRRRDGEE